MPLKITRSFKTRHYSLRGPYRFPYLGVTFHAASGSHLLVLFYAENRGVALQPESGGPREYREVDFFPLAEPITIENDITVDS